eukprot:10049415-Lingulodinium_polyedra.AAC.1
MEVGGLAQKSREELTPPLVITEGMVERVAVGYVRPGRRHRGSPMEQMLPSCFAGSAERADLMGTR